MTECADSTMLRTHLDVPDDELDSHLDGCETCAGLLLSVAVDAGYVHRTLGLLDAAREPVDVEAALAAALAQPTTPVVTPFPASTRLATAGRRLLLAAAGLLVVALVAVTPAGRSAVAATLDAFRGERLQAVSVDLDDLADSSFQGLTALEALGDVDLSDLEEPRQVPDVAAAERVAGIAAPVLPDDRPAPDRVVALAPGEVRLTLAADEANGVPADLDGAALIVEVPGVLGAIYGPADGPPELVVGRSGPLVVRAEGASLDDLRSFLLSRDELPDDLRSQLADIDDWRSTIPVPVPLDGPGWRAVEVAGRQAIAFGDDTGLGAMVLRQDPEGVTIVGGRIPVSRALALAADA